MTLWTVVHQASLSTGFSRPEYWSGLPCPPPGDLPNPGIEPNSPTLQADSLPSEPPGKPAMWETWFNSWVGKIPWRREQLTTPVFWPGACHGLYSPWSHKESDTTEQLSLCNPMDYSLPGSSVHGISQGRILEWVAISPR